MGADGIKPVSTGMVTNAYQTPVTKQVGVKKNIEAKGQNAPAAVLELSSEGVHRLDAEKAQSTLKAIKDQLPYENLSEIHSNLRAMKINQLIID